MNRRVFAAGAAGVFALAGGGARADTLDTKAAIARLFTAPALQEAWFEPAFLAAVPLPKLQSILAGIVARLGPFQSVAPNGAAFTAHFANGMAQVRASLDAAGAFSGLQFYGYQDAANLARLTALLTATDPIPADWFAASFLAAVPIDRVRGVIAGMKDQFGAFSAVRPAVDGTYDVVFAKTTASCMISLDTDGKIDGLVFRPKAP